MPKEYEVPGANHGIVRPLAYGKEQTPGAGDNYYPALGEARYQKLEIFIT